MIPKYIFQLLSGKALNHVLHDSLSAEQLLLCLKNIV
jgi:hypothetical protein